MAEPPAKAVSDIRPGSLVRVKIGYTFPTKMLMINVSIVVAKAPRKVINGRLFDKLLVLCDGSLEEIWHGHLQNL